MNIVIFLIFTTIFYQGCKGNHDSLTDKEDNPSNITVELLIICDKEFSDMFQQDHQKITDYWTMQLYDVNMRFKTLKSQDISFRVTQLLIISNTTDQPFIEKIKIENGSAFPDQFFSDFGYWKHTQKKYNLSEYDIAVVATAAKKMLPVIDNWDYVKQVTKMACSPYSNVFIKYMTSPWGYQCASLAGSLGQAMGAPYDFGNSIQRCPPPDCLGGYLRSFSCGKLNFFFSQCSDSGISEFVKGWSANCLKTLDAPGHEVISANAKILTPPSFQKQCEMLAENENGLFPLVGMNDEGKCISVECTFYINGTANVSYTRTFYPLENTPCDDNKICFRGRCIPKGYQLYTISERKCVYSSNRFSSHDSPILKDCVSSPTPLDQFMLLSSVSNDTVYLAVPFASPDADKQRLPEIKDKCLAVEVDGNYTFRKCDNENYDILGWNLLTFDQFSDIFLLYHPFSKTCAAADENGIRAEKNCRLYKNLIRWKLVGNVDIRAEWFIKSLDDVLPPEDNYIIWVSVLTLSFGSVMLGMLLYFGIRRFRLSSGSTCSILHTKGTTK